MNVADLCHKDGRQHRTDTRDLLDRLIARIAGEFTSDQAGEGVDLGIR
ncbi:hypothetical protein [Saccharopolyspora sp. ASAGF58]|nr:hypothetical protein [Saccharopolyspora sp. ASAGF58]